MRFKYVIEGSIRTTSRYLGTWIRFFLYNVYHCFYTCQVDIFRTEDVTMVTDQVKFK